MHDSLQLMAEQPWARWLHVKIRNYYSVNGPPACWQANSWLKTAIIKVSMCNDSTDYCHAGRPRSDDTNKTCMAGPD
ncbi:hypothetical protein HaLaN_28690 [Haematococcus lacustris]|uniref:Uncharacterized protein n=1 Tax=Haematococcus lacustris TaxID=44745 RepID=A0A6A0ADJ6_HAELA|nr:hypothetical protein HaLaN_28690 [Haematococcus lacustris]